MESSTNIFNDLEAQQEINKRLVIEVIEATRDGSVVQWTDRIAAIAGIAGLQLENINWHGSPNIVTSRVIEATLHQFGNDYEQVLTSASNQFKQAQTK